MEYKNVANVGDRIEVTEVGSANGPFFSLGEVGIVTRVDSDGDIFVDFGDEIDFAVERMNGDDYRVLSTKDGDSSGSASEPADAVAHPPHYTRGKYETIEVIEHIVEGYSDPFVSHCVGTATKYLDRAPYKHEDITEDLRKARAYLDFAIEKLDGGVD